MPLTQVLLRLYPQSQALSPTSAISALVLLNGSSVTREHLDLAWPSGAVNCPVICADGAANLLFESDPSRIPTHLVGDFDSVQPKIRKYYEARGTSVIERPSQDAGDFAKAMEVARDCGIQTGAPVLVLGGYPGAGRLDHLFGNLQALCSSADRQQFAWWIGEKSASIVLDAGRHALRIDPTLEGALCGLIPVAGPVSNITTAGLKWNLTRQDMRFGLGGLVSSSNEINDAIVEVETNGLLLWTSELWWTRP
jgi:thiamine pyrophosphokinase